jgi:hypothetical protein
MHLLHFVIIECIIYGCSNHLHLLPIYLWYLPIYVSHLSKGKESTNICKIGYQSCPLNLSCVFYNFICGSSNLARISPFLNANLPLCVYITHWPNECSTFAQCAHDNECIEMHVVVCDTSIILEVNFHVVQEQLHMLPFVTIHSSHWWVDIILFKNGD